MRALKLNAYIGTNHRLELDLPADVPPGTAEVIVLVHDTETTADEEHRQYLNYFFSRLESTDRHRLSKEEIDRYLEEERASWGE